MGKRKRWFRDDYAEALWKTDALKANEVLIALAYADHAGDKDNPDNDVAWVTRARLSQRTGIRSKDAINRAIRGLKTAGWLVEIKEATQHYSARYRLVIPANPEVRETYVSDDSEVRETDAWEGESAGSEVRLPDCWHPPEVRQTTPEVRENGARGTGDVPDYSTDLSPLTSPVVAPGAQPQDVRASCRHRRRTVDGDCLDCGASLADQPPSAVVR